MSNLARAVKRRGKKEKKFNISMADVPNITDAEFAGNYSNDMQGWVIMKVNDRGRACVDALFPRAYIAWRDDDDPAVAGCGWKTFELDLLDAIADGGTKLRLEMTRGADLNEAHPDALAFLLADGVNCQGGRSAVLSNGKLSIFVNAGSTH
jgi:hypothetical protein